MSGKVNLDRWSPHLAAARREGKTLTQYARRRGLSRHTLYAARQMLRGEEGKPRTLARARADRRTKRRARSTFAAVKVWAPTPSGPAPRLQAQLPNGVRLELMWEGAAGAGLLAVAIQALAGR